MAASDAVTVGGRFSQSARRPGVRGVARVLGRAVLVLWLTYTVVFVVLYLLPSDPAAIMLSQSEEQAADPVALDRLREQYGLDRPLIVQYVFGILGILRGDFGASLSQRKPVIDVIGGALPDTLALAALGLVLTVVIAIVLAVVAMTSRFAWLRSLARTAPAVLGSLPVFFLALLLIQMLAFTVPLFPATGNRGFSALILPAITLGITSSAALAQVFITALDHAYREPYIATARAAAAPPWTVLLRHAFRNAAIPAVTVLGVIVGTLLSGTVVVETVFARPGLGRVIQTGVLAQDLPLVQGAALIAAAIVVGANLVVDLAYPLLDSRVRGMPLLDSRVRGMRTA